MKTMIEPVESNSQSYVPWLISAAVVALAFGGVGGSLQISRIVCILILPVALARLLSFTSKVKFQTETLVFIFLLMIISLTSIVWSIDKASTMQYLVVMMINLIPLLMIALLTPGEAENLRQLLPRAWLLAGVAVLPLAIYELTTGNHFALGFEERGGGTMVNLLPFASGVHGNYNDFSLFLVLCIFGTCFAKNNKSDINKRAQYFKYSIIALISMVVVINSSRAAILCLAAILFARFILPLRKGHFISIFILVAIFAGFSISLWDNDSLLLKFLQLKFTDFSNDFEASEGRLAILISGLKGFFDSFGLGVGAGASSSYLATDKAILIPNPHNLLLEWALNFGLIGFCLLLWFISRMWSANKKNNNDINRRLNYVAILILPLLGVIQSHLTGYTYFWLMLSTMAAFAIWPALPKKG
ncbi:O-antigen ligase family protein [Janthinobacterium sp. PSPC2-1]|uniref:O-antigen ligase family protein n=1 Tax=unclassified Janthinobacterium TaxID=2610881 RepID=UPI003CF9EFB6